MKLHLYKAYDFDCYYNIRTNLFGIFWRASILTNGLLKRLCEGASDCREGADDGLWVSELNSLLLPTSEEYFKNKVKLIN